MLVKVTTVTHPGSSTETEKTMQNPNLSFWAQEEGNRPDLLCGRSADYTIEKVYFPVLVCSTIVLGGRWVFF